MIPEGEPLCALGYLELGVSGMKVIGVINWRDPLRSGLRSHAQPFLSSREILSWGMVPQQKKCSVHCSVPDINKITASSWGCLGFPWGVLLR